MNKAGSDTVGPCKKLRLSTLASVDNPAFKKEDGRIENMRHFLMSKISGTACMYRYHNHKITSLTSAFAP